MRKSLPLAILAVFTLLPVSHATAPRFYSDDPLWSEPDTQDASRVAAHEVDVDYQIIESMFWRPGDQTLNVRAQNLNTIDEVPDSSWYTNRAGRRPLTEQDLTAGPNTTRGPAAGGWNVISAKADGITPGFVVRDSADAVWFVKFDPPGYGEMATGAEVISTKLLWALGYHVPENHIASVRPEDLSLDRDARIRTPRGSRPMQPADLAKVLKLAHRDSTGAYRVVASRQIDGRPLGGFRFYGTRSDDPNDYIPHEHRRELRGYGTVSAWLNHVDCKSTNTLDVLVSTPGGAVVRHYLLDFGSTLGSAGVKPRESFEGWEHLYEPREMLKSVFSIGGRVQPWRTVPMYSAPSVGAFPLGHDSWDPDVWRPRFPNPAFARARADDQFWAARRIQALTPKLIAATIAAAEYSDPRAADMVLTFLVERRAAILRKYLRQVNPIADLRLDSDGTLTFTNVAVDADVAVRPRQYRARWFEFDNATGTSTALGESMGPTTRLQAPKPITGLPGAFLRIDVSAEGSDEPSWADPAHAFFRSDGSAWTLVGFERMPAGNQPAPFRATGRLTERVEPPQAGSDRRGSAAR